MRERTVKPGLLSGDSVEIKDGLKEGEVVVMRAGSLLRSGDAISPQFAEKQTAERTGAGVRNEHFRMVHPAAHPFARAFPGADDAGPLELSKPGHHSVSQHRHPDCHR